MILTIILCTLLVCLALVWCTKVIAGTLVRCPVSNNSLHEEKKGETVIKEVKKKPSDDAVYSGVIHKFVHNKVRRERPVMMYSFRGNTVYIEYDEQGNKMFLNKKQKADIELVLMGEKGSGAFKKYELKSTKKS